MYTNIKTYQIIIALLKKYGIKHLVLSAGSRNVPFVHSVEEDDFFTCYSVVDERSAAYFAMGLSQQIHQPVLISCTASTASSNYWPAVGEAFYQGVPIIILTSDRNPTRLHQWEDQMIDQVGMFDRHVKKSVNLPIINDEDDWLYCQRLVNEALLELDHNGTGPVHINVPTKNYNMSFDTIKLPDVRKIERIQVLSPKSIWEQARKDLASCKRILVTCGQQSFIDAEFNALLSAFFRKYDCVISTEHMSNVVCEGSIKTSVCFETRYLSPKLFAEFCPDIVISYGYNISQGLKQQLLSYKGVFKHWSLQPDGHVVDMYNSLTNIFECPPSYFFKYMVENAADDQKNDQEYYHLVKTFSETVKYPEFDFSSTYAIQQVVTQIPAKSILHMAINNSIRISNFFEINPEVRSYANIGTYGIDGSLSSLIGQSTATEELCFMIIGDLSFFYDMNCLRIKHIGNNVRILLLNNEGGGEFYYNGSWFNNSSDLHTTARHHTKAEGWVKENNFIYLHAHDKASFDEAMKTFMRRDLDKSVFLEVFSEMKKDSDVIYDFYNLSRPIVMSDEVKKKFKGMVRSVLPKSIISSIKNK